MNRILLFATLGLAVVVSVPVATAEETEDYAGLPLYGEDYTSAPREYVISEVIQGYDGLPVTRLNQPEGVRAKESAFVEGYDGLPAEENADKTGTLAIW